MHIFYSYELVFKYLFQLDTLNKTVDEKILHGCLDGIRTVPSNGKTMLFVNNMFGQETLYSTDLRT